MKIVLVLDILLVQIVLFVILQLISPVDIVLRRRNVGESHEAKTS